MLPVLGEHRRGIASTGSIRVLTYHHHFPEGATRPLIFLSVNRGKNIASPIISVQYAPLKSIMVVTPSGDIV